MPVTTLLFGSIGVVAETSDIQRRAYNRALAEAGLGWDWDRETYSELLNQSGGKDRLAMLAAATGTPLTPAAIDAIHARKTEIACAEVVARRVAPRPGVVALLRLARERGLRTGFVTSTYRANIEAILTAAAPALTAADFDVVIGRDDVAAGKPAPDAYRTALERLGAHPEAALAIEDTASSVIAARRAGIAVVATPGELTGNQDLWAADLVVPALADAGGVIDPRVLAMLGW